MQTQFLTPSKHSAEISVAFTLPPFLLSIQMLRFQHKPQCKHMSGGWVAPSQVMSELKSPSQYHNWLPHEPLTHCAHHHTISP